ncbi:energy-coupling factor transporter ATPase [Evansella sp. AB-rgal1]|uniref:energy-coupling factor transporter ATPase n=1 Tax=Evansella sp. AB-rgal1 TaxID=3242696 RepID=UPI00359DFC13
MEIKAEDIGYTYMAGTPFEKKAIDNINIHIKHHSYTAIIGHTGSGKSTFVQLLNGLLKPSRGSLHVGNWVITKETKQKQMYDLRKHVGMVFQYPEHQLFHETVIQDVAYGPINFGFSKKEAREKAEEMLLNVGIGKDLFDRSPFELSGGQMRRVAIAGVLAIEPHILVLDEPTAGLDPKGQVEIMNLFYSWYLEKEERSIVLVTHHMEDAALYGDHIIVMNNGEVHFQGEPTHVFQQKEMLYDLDLSVPETVALLERLKEISGEAMNTQRYTFDETVQEIISFLRKVQ